MNLKQIQIFTKYWIPVIAWGSLIFFLSSLSSLPTQTIDLPFLDKTGHLFEYFILGFLICRALRNTQKKITRKKTFFLTILFCLLYGISDEVHQLFIPQREFEFYDIIADVSGAILSQIIYGKHYE